MARNRGAVRRDSKPVPRDFPLFPWARKVPRRALCRLVRRDAAADRHGPTSGARRLFRIEHGRESNMAGPPTRTAYVESDPKRFRSFLAMAAAISRHSLASVSYWARLSGSALASLANC